MDVAGPGRAASCRLNEAVMAAYFSAAPNSRI